MNLGTLYLIPVPIGPAGLNETLPANVISTTRKITDFVVENAKTARLVLKSFEHPIPLREIRMSELNEHTPLSDIPRLLEPALQGRPVGLMSEAGCPAVADPGSALVEHAHANAIRVVPLVGPSSILLALMASGMNGQCFSFHGYLPAREPERLISLKKLENLSRNTKAVQIFIETPYRNGKMLDSCLQLSPSTRLCIASGLTQADEWIRSMSVRDWKTRAADSDLDRRPAIFLLQAA